MLVSHASAFKHYMYQMDLLDTHCMLFANGLKTILMNHILANAVRLMRIFDVSIRFLIKLLNFHSQPLSNNIEMRRQAH